jgi:hypothetical protein
MKKIFYLWFLFFCYFCNNITANDSGTAKFQIPFQNDHNILLVKARINDRVDANLAIDNGCDEILLNQKFVNKYADLLGIKEYFGLLPFKPTLQYARSSMHIAECDLKFGFGNLSIRHTSIYQYYIKDAIPGKEHKIDKFVEVYTDTTDYFGLNIDGVLPLRLFAEKGIIKINNNDKCIEFVNEIDSGTIKYPFVWEMNTQIVKFPVSFTNDTGKKYTYTLKTLLDLGCNEGLLLFNNLNTKPMLNVLKQIDANADSRYILNAELGKNNTVFKFCRLRKDNRTLGYDLIVGLGILSEYNLYFDYQSQIIGLQYLALANSSKSTFLIQHYFKNGKYSHIVAAVDKDNCWLDLQKGDELYKAGDILIESLLPLEVKNFLRDSKHNAIITVKRNGKLIELPKKQKEYDKIFDN